MRPASSPFLPRWLLPGLIAFGAFLLWISATGRWSARDWTVPEDFGGDPLEIYTRAQIAAEDPVAALRGFPHVERRGAPFGADWSGYPVSDGPAFALTGLLARGLGPFAAVKLMSALFIAAAAVSFYLCARHLRWRPEWAAAGALLFAFTNYQLRWAVTLSLVQTWTLPPLVLLCGYATRRALPPVASRRWLLMAGLLGAWMGCGNPYFVLFGGLVAAGAVGMNRLRAARWARLRPLGLYLAALTAFCTLVHLPLLLRAAGSAAASAQFHRGFAAADLYAFKPLDLLVPPAEHRLAALGAVGRRYVTESALQGEFFYNYLGLAGLAGLVWLLAVAVRRTVQTGPRPPVPEAALGVLACTLFAMVGGANSLAAFAGFDWFRASNRSGVFLSLWALFFLCGQLQRFTVGRSRRFTITLAAVIGVAGLWEQVPLLDASAVRRAFAPQVEADRRTVASLEQTLGRSARVFQLPVVPFPEAGRLFDLGDYEHFRPFLAPSSLRFSHGALRGTAAGRWAARLAVLPTGEMLAALNQAGFAALWIDRRGFPDRAAALLERLRAANLTELPTPRAPDIVVLRLTPGPATTLPDLDDPRLDEPWDSGPPAAADQPALQALADWYPLERTEGRAWRWAGRRALLGLHCPAAAPALALQFRVGSLAKGRLVLSERGHVMWENNLPGGPPVETVVKLALGAGGHRLEFTFEGEPVQPSPTDTRRLGFCIENLRVAP